MSASRTAAIGAGVGVAAASVITLLVLKGDPEVPDERSAPPITLTPPTVPRTLPDAVAKPSPAPVDKPVLTAPTEAKAEADQAKAEQARVDAARISRAEAIRMARSVSVLGQTNLTGTIPADLYGPRTGTIGRTALPMVSFGQFTVAPMVATTADPGGIDKAIVRRYLKRNLVKLLYCYEKQLLAKPDIKGALVVTFTIEQTGLVTNTTISGVDGDVASCMNGVISGIEFPKPKGIGGVKIATRFELRPAGS